MIPDIILKPLVHFGGFVAGMIVLANFFASRKIGYARNLAKVEPIVREIFSVHCAYIVYVVAGMAAACLFYTDELLNATGLARGFVCFTALFWGARVPVQLFYYDREIKRRNPGFHLLFTLAFAYLALLFLSLALFR